MTSPREIELKLDMAPADAARLGRRILPRLGGTGETQHLVSVYFDTPAGHLRKKALTLRVRSDGTRSVQTVKQGSGPAVGFFDRAEWEADVADGSPDLAAAADTPIGKVLRKHPDAAVGPAFTTIVDRTTWCIALGESEIEVALDEGRVESGGRQHAFAELELELKQGTPRDLFALVRRIDRAGALKLGVLTKSERGYALADGDQPTSFKAGPVDLHPGMTAGEAFRAIVYACIRHMRVNEGPLLATRSVESLHQTRVALRRLRSAFSLFGPALGGLEAARLKRRLREIAGPLGTARNLDVYLARVLRPQLERDPEAADLAAYVRRMEADREAAYDSVLATLDGARFRKLMLDLVAWIEAGPARGRVDPEAAAIAARPIEDFAADVLERRRRKVKRAGRHLAALAPADRHRVRIKAKKLRYAAEFFAGLVSGRKHRERHKAFLDALETLQSDLGDLNDIETAREIAADTSAAAPAGISGEPAPTALEPDPAAETGDAHAADLLKSAIAAHRRLVKAKRFWQRPHR
jgi:triphosphatase